MQLLVPAQCSWAWPVGYHRPTPARPRRVLNSAESGRIVSGSGRPTDTPGLDPRRSRGRGPARRSPAGPRSPTTCAAPGPGTPGHAPVDHRGPATQRPSANSTEGRPTAIPPPPSRYSVRSARPCPGGELLGRVVAALLEHRPRPGPPRPAPRPAVAPPVPTHDHHPAAPGSRSARDVRRVTSPLIRPRPARATRSPAAAGPDGRAVGLSRRRDTAAIYGPGW